MIKVCCRHFIHIAAMHCHQLLVVLVLVHATASSSPLNVTVSDKGTDNSSCLQMNTTQACRTLEFVLKQLFSPLESDVILVNVLNNQSLDVSSPYIFNSPFTLVVTGVGYPSITFDSNGNLTMHCNSSSNFTWRGLVFKGGNILHQNLHTITFDDCKLLLPLGMDIRYVRKMIINNSDVGVPNTRCTPIFLRACNDSVPCNVIFSSNTIANCGTTPLSNLLYFNLFGNLTIINNVFTQLNLTQVNRLVFVSGITMSLTFQNNSFVENIIGLGIEFEISGSNGQITVQQNRFLHNEIPKKYNVFLQAIFYFDMIQSSNLNVIFSENLYYNNSKLLILNLQTDSTSTVNAILNSESVIDNIGPSTPQQCLPITDIAIKKNCLGLFILEGLKELNLSNITASGNRIYIDTNAIPRGDELSHDGYVRFSSLFFLANNTDMFLSDTVFSKNYGTPIIFWHVFIDIDIDSPFSLTLSGNVVFANNIGFLGGAFAAYNKDINIYTISSTYLKFIGNYALYGGAGYIEKMAFGICDDNLTINFTDNSAVTNGDTIYFSTDPSNTVKPVYCKNVPRLNTVKGIHSYATNLSYVPNLDSTEHLIFPGQELIVNITITDYFGLPSSCTADIYLQCDNMLLLCPQQVTLKGPETVVLAQANNTTYSTIDTGHILESSQDVNNNVSVLLRCRNTANAQVMIPLNITQCPLGFYYSQKERVCKCIEGVGDNLFVCSSRYGGSCVAHGYWYGEFATDNSTGSTAYTVSKCSFPECALSYEACPSELLPAGATSEFFRLHFDPDSQCSEGRGGVLCRNCAQDYAFTFTASSCVPDTECVLWQPFLILLFSLVFQVTIALMLFFLVRFKFALGSGILYCPMFFLAIVHHLPLDNYPFLNTAVSMVSSIPLINLELFGLIPWCFFHPVSKLYNYFLHYLGPLIILIVISLIFLFARWCPNLLRRIQSSPLRALCILMFLSFWSLSDISLNILTPVVIRYKAGQSVSTGLFVSIQPDVKYFSLSHIPVAIPALLVMIVVIAPLVFILFGSTLLSKVTNLNRIKPFLDEFQSCYKDNFRWFSSVYFIVWIALIIILIYSDVFAYQTILVLLLLTHIVIQPYSSTTLNIMDTLLLTDVNILVVLINYYPASFIPAQIAVYSLVLGPLLFAGIYLVYYLAIKYDVWTRIKGARKKKNLQPKQLRLPDEEDDVVHHNVTTQHISVEDFREPLIAVVNAD